MKKIFQIFIVFTILIEIGLIFISIFVDFNVEKDIEESSFLEEDQAWADTLLSHMNLDEKIGQMFLINLDNAKIDSFPIIDSLIIKYSIGGLKFTKTDLFNQLILTNSSQSKSKYPLLIGSEGSLINQENFNIPIGAILNMQNDSAFADLYLKNFAEILKHESVQIDFSNNLSIIDSLNPNTGFSDKPYQMVYQSSFLRKQLHKNRIFSCLHYNDSVFNKSGSQPFDSVEIQKQSIPIDKFFALNLDPELIKTIITNKKGYTLSFFLRKYKNFNGLIISNLNDSIKSDGLKKLFKSGTDIFVTTKNIEKYIDDIHELIRQKKISEKEVNSKVKRVLMAKKWAGLDKPKFKSAEQSAARIYEQNRKKLSWQIYEKSICLIKNHGNILPFSKLSDNATHIITIDKSNYSALQQYLNYYIDAGRSEYENADKLQKDVAPFRNIIVAFGRPLANTNQDSLLIQTLKKISKSKRVIAINFGNQANIKKLMFAQVLIQLFDTHTFSQMVCAQTITGAIVPKGQLPSLLTGIKAKTSFSGIDRLQYAIPEAIGFNSLKLRQIDSLVEQVIKAGATPGCQILAAKDGKIFYYKSFGHLQYFGDQKVDNSDVYDLASITKVAATTMASMKLYEKGKINLNDSLKYYIDDTIHCTIKNHQLKDFFLHQSGLQPDMPILKYIRYMKHGMGRFDMYYSPVADTAYTLEVAKDFYLRKNFLDSIKSSLYNLKWDSAKTYRYSDINFNIIFDVILRKLNEDYVSYLNKSIYNPLQLRSIGFMPINRLPENRIAPTQEDKFWRKQLLIGTPHDESAAVYGGISGNAGLFSNANELAVLFQMLLNGGTYGGQRIFDKETIEYFTRKQENSSHGLGFAWNNGFYGHTGFTGCVVWANPETKMIFIFLSNSICPKPANQKLKQMKIRSKILNIILSAYNPQKLNEIDEE